MEILNAYHITKTFGTHTVLEDISFAIGEGDKVGLMGVNGAGKTTLFKIITGEDSFFDGTVVKQKNLKIAYMPQQVDYYSQKTAMEDVLDVFQHFAEMERQLASFQCELEEGHSDIVIRRFSDLNERYIAEGGLTYRSRARSMLMGLGLLEQELSLRPSELSGGQRTRVLLAKLLLAEPNILLLDEPTNHLDLEAVEWLENFLSGYRGTVLVISHDRYFLDKFVNRIFELENRRLLCYNGNYSTFVKLKAEALLAQQRDYDKKIKELRRIEGIIAQQKQWNTERSLVTARSKQKIVDRIQQEIDKPEAAPKRMKLAISANARSGNDVLTIKGLEKSFGEHHLFQNVDIDLKRKERVVLLGKNGIGKTTLFRIILGKESACHGEVEFGANVSVGYYTQAQENLPLQKSILDAVYEQASEEKLGRVRNMLAAFLFTEDAVEKKIEMLSGGERARVALAILMLSPHNLLLLDEPTNHLDIPSRETLEEALLNYDGTLFIVSHDRYFIRKIATKIYELDTCGTVSYPGGYEYFIEKKAVEKGPSEARSVKNTDESLEDYRKKRQEESQRRKRAYRTEKLEAEIASMEEQTRQLKEKLALPEVFSDYQQALEITGEIAKLEETLSLLYEEWTETQPEE